MAFWHGRILPSIYFFRDRDIVVITSDNFDGEWTAKIIHRFGYTTARGSTSRNAARAALRAKRRMEEGHAVGITVDGPRGPALVVQPGALWLAKSTGNPIVPFHIEARSYWTAPSWDASQIPCPFSRVAVVFGEPFYVPADADEAALEAARVELGERMLALQAPRPGAGDGVIDALRDCHVRRFRRPPDAAGAPRVARARRDPRRRRRARARARRTRSSSRGRQAMPS